MMCLSTYRLFLLLSFMLTTSVSLGQTKVEKRILFLLDGSSSMNYFLDGGKQIDVARQILNDIADSLNQMNDVETALRVYGHQSSHTKNDCLDTRLEVPFASENAVQIRSSLNDIVPKGITPIAYSLQQAAADFPDQSAKNVILLITDGEEKCEYDLCEVAADLRRTNASLETFIIGFGLDGTNKQNFDCVGKYFDASNFTMLRLVLTEVVKKVVYGTTAQVNLMDKSNRAKASDVGMTFYLKTKANDIYNIYHTMHNNRPDSFAIASFDDYKLTIHTNPPIHDESVSIKPSIHNTLNYKAPLGELIIAHSTKPTASSRNHLTALVQPSGDTSFVYQQRVNESANFISGKYDLDILTLPYERWENFQIETNQKNIVDIDQPGELLITKRFIVVGGIFHNKNKRLEKIHSLGTDREDELIYLQPGEYTLIYKPKFNPKSSSIKKMKILVHSGEPIKINL